MKKLVIIGMTMVCAALGAYAQGTVTFGNTASTLVKYDPSVPMVGGTAVPIGSMKVALYWGVLGSAENMLVQIGGTAGISPLAGRFSGGTRTTGNATAPGASATFQARAWSIAYTTYEDAVASGNASAFQGKSPLFDSATGGAGTPPSSPINLAPVIPVLNVVPIPEPSVIALGILGLGSLLLFRRRK